MMKNNQTSSPEIMLGSVTSIEELPIVYGDVLSIVVGDYNLSLSGLSSWTDGFRESGLPLDKYLSEHRQKVQDVTSDGSRKIGKIVGLIPDILDDLSDFSDIDRATFANAQRDARSPLRGIGYALTHDVPNASSKQARTAIHSALDGIILENAQHDARSKLRGIGYALTHDVPNASSEQARQIIEYEVASNTTSSRSSYNHQRQSEGRRNSHTHSGSRQSHKGTSNSGQKSQKESGSNDKQRQSNPNGKSTNQDSKEPSAYDKLMAKLKKENFDMHKTLCGFEEVDVTRVIQTVLKIREKDPEITDRKIALRYLRRTNNIQNPDTTHLTASQIVLTLLDGSIKNKFPF